MSTLGVLVGLNAEARIARRDGWTVLAGGGTAEGAERAVAELVAGGATGLLSFGLAGGLDPALRPGALVVPEAVLVDGRCIATDRILNHQFGSATVAALLGGRVIASTAAAKQALWRQTGAAAVDLESGVVALAAEARGLRFTAVRAVCDPADRSLPPAALVALNRRGAIGLLRVLASVARSPSQIPALLRLAADAAAARQALTRV